MNAVQEPQEVILVVDDEESVRRTIRDWLAEANLGVEVLTANDPESALLKANARLIDLAILDWNLGAGVNGLELLQDLAEFNPNIVAIMITAYADQATPLDAMRRGVRDYLDKNQEFTRDSFLATVEKQLRYIRPAKRERRLHQSLVEFRDSVEKILPLSQSLAVLNDPVTLPEAIRSFFRFLLNITHARDGVLFVRHYQSEDPPEESSRIYDADGRQVDVELIPFAGSIAATVISMQEPCMMTRLSEHEMAGALQLQPYERNRESLLAAPLAVAPGIHVVVELFDKQTSDGSLERAGFTSEDLKIVRDAGDFGAEMLRQELAQRRAHQMLLDAVGAALSASKALSESISSPQPAVVEKPLPNEVLEKLQEGLVSAGGTPAAAREEVQLAEAIRALTAAHGRPAVQYCIHLVEQLKGLLDQVMR